MERANIMLALAGDRGNSVPKYNMTAAEIGVLQAIHGAEAVYDVEPTEIDDEVDSRAERQRLFERYRNATDGDGQVIVRQLFPGAAARIFETIEELGLPEDAFKATTRVSATALKAKAEAKPRSRKAKAAEEAAPEEDTESVME